MAAPQVPQRPARSQNIDVPSNPLTQRRSLDEHRASFARSPLNDGGFLANKPPHSSSYSKSPKDTPRRPPSVTLPSIGQEGNEYADVHSPSPTAVEQTKSVGNELPLHAPKASLPASSAKARISAVTRTDSDTAAAVGIGRPSSDAGDHVHHQPTSGLANELTRTTSAGQGGRSRSRPGSAQSRRSRPSSVYKGDVSDDDEEHGIPLIGQQIPLYRHAGDVQAPTPGPSERGTPVGKGRTLRPGEGRNHTRTKSGREIFHGPPGSYGMHGHGKVNHKDPFEKEWYEKHPEAAAREAQGQYGPHVPIERKTYNLSSADLNRLVQSNEHLNELHSSTPDEQIGYLASEEYAQRISGSRPGSSAKRRSQQFADSPLRKQSFPNADKTAPDLEGESGDDEVIHVDPPAIRLPAEGHGVVIVGYDEDDQPILASDEVAKRRGSQYMLPAVDIDREDPSRPQSRSNSHHSANKPILKRMASSDYDNHTSLDDVKEYEPLFPDDEEGVAKKKAYEKAKKNARHYFPSKDIWEDTPESLRYETTVDGPQEPEDPPQEEPPASRSFETPEQEKNRQDQAERPDIKGKPKSFLNKAVLAETRPSVRHRFPSQDVWEDTPDSLMYTTTVDDEQREAANQEDDTPASRAIPAIPSRPKPQVPSRPARIAKTGSSEDVPLAKSTSTEEPFAGAAAAKSKPPVPSRPGNKISALRGAFMNDLESRLSGGPKPPVSKSQDDEEEQQPEDKAPLQDARKGRARGPARRKPGASAAETETSRTRSAPKVSFMSAVTIWEIDEEGDLTIGKPGAEKTGASDKTGAPPAADKTTQTGQVEIEVPDDDGEPIKTTVYLGGKVPEEGNAVVQDQRTVEGAGEAEREAAVKAA